jgi:hypothetical protein
MITKGRHYRFRKSPRLDDWIGETARHPSSRQKGKQSEARAEKTFLAPIQECCFYFANHPITAKTPLEAKRTVWSELKPLWQIAERIRLEIEGGAPGKCNTNTRETL